MSYFLILLSVAGIAAQFCITKVYQRRTLAPGERTLAALEKSVFFSMGSGLAAGVFFFCMAGFQVEFSSFSLLMAVCLNVISITNLLLGMLVMSMGEVSVYTLFMMLGGMVLPFLFGAFFWQEQISAARIIGLVLLIGSLLLPVFGGAKKEGKQASKGFFILCALVFCLNGTTSILSKLHQITPGAAPTNSFLVLNNGIGFVMAALLFLVLKCIGKRRAQAAPAVPQARKAFIINCGLVVLYAVVSGCAYMFQLLGAVTLDASLLYPMVTGGTIVLGTIFGWLFFKEKPGLSTWLSTGITLFATFLFLF